MTAPAKRKGDGQRGDKRGLRRGGGVTGRFLGAALALQLRDDQKAAIEKIQEGLSPKPDADDARKKAMAAVSTEISSGIKAGKIDTAKLDPLYAEIEKAHKERQEAEAKALGELHAKLDAAQRKSVVEALRADQKRREERVQKMMERAKPTAAADDESSAGKTAAGSDPKAGRRGFGTRRLDRLTRDLELDDAQKKKVEELAAKEKPADPIKLREDQQKRMNAVLDAFEKDTFDASKLDFSTSAPVKEHSKAMLAELNALLSIIKPEQRDKLAEAVQRQHETLGRGPGRGMGPRMGGRMGRGPMGPGGPHGPGMLAPPMGDELEEGEPVDD